MVAEAGSRREPAGGAAPVDVPAGATAVGAAAAASEAADAVYRQIRTEMRFELELMNARVNWLVASQAFLFVPLTIGAQGGGVRASFFYPMIPVLGVVICVLVLVSILAAAWRAHQWRVKARQGAYRGEAAHREFSIVAPWTPAIPAMGLVGAVGVPLVLGATWVVVLAAPPGG